MSLTIITYNLYASSANLIVRYQTLQKIIIQNKPAIVCLQEITTDWLQILIASEFFKKYYNFSKKKIIHSFETLTLIFKKFTITKIKHFMLPHTKMARSYEEITIIIGKALPNNKFHIINTHLDSIYRHTDSENHKAQQLQFLFRKYQKIKNCIIGLDSNLINYVGHKNWKDAYLDYTSSHDAGNNNQFQIQYTYTSKYNSLIKGNYQSRLDRIYYNNSYWKTTHLKLLGYSSEQQDLGLSDHFGLLIILHL